jgi:hypothetical protein
VFIYYSVLDLNDKTMKEWEDLDAIVFETTAMKCLIKMIEEEDIVTVIGDGKYMTYKIAKF